MHVKMGKILPPLLILGRRPSDLKTNAQMLWWRSPIYSAVDPPGFVNRDSFGVSDLGSPSLFEVHMWCCHDITREAWIGCWHTIGLQSAEEMMVPATVISS